MHIKKLVALIFVTIFAILSFTGCFDLGEFEDEEEYLSSFDSFVFVKENGDTVSGYNMEDFYNKEAINDFVSPLSEDERQTFVYLYFRVNKTFTMGELAMYFNSSTAGELGVSLFVLSSDKLPTKLYDPDSEEDESNEPSDDEIIARSSVSLNGESDDWQPVDFGSFTYNGESNKSYNVSEGDYIVIRFENNHYDFAKRKLDKSEKEVNDANEHYNTMKALYDELKIKFDNGDSSVSQSDVSIARNNMNTAQEQYDTKFQLYRTEQDSYEKNKSKYTEKMSVRMTALLIYAEKGGN